MRITVSSTDDEESGKGAPVELKHGEQRVYVVGVVRQQLRDAVWVHAGLALLKQGLNSLHGHTPNVTLLPHGLLGLPEMCTTFLLFTQHRQGQKSSKAAAISMGCIQGERLCSVSVAGLRWQI